MRSSIEDMLILKLRGAPGGSIHRTVLVLVASFFYIIGREHVTDATVFGHCLSLARVAFGA